MGRRYNLNDYDNDGLPFWAKVLACVVVGRDCGGMAPVSDRAVVTG